MSHQNIITIEAGKRGQQPCIRKRHIAVADVIGCLAFAADCKRRVLTAA